MNDRVSTALPAALIAASVVLTAIGCAFRSPDRRIEPLPSRVELPEPRRIAQLRIGRDIRFTLCVEPACPSLTPKTLSTAEPLRTAAPLMPDAAESPAATPITLASTPAPPPEPPSLPEPRQRQVVVHFHSGKASLTEAGRTALRASITLARASERILISGRTDAIGDDAMNETLAFARAMAVRDYLRRQFPDLPNVIAISARGNCCFIAENDTASGRQQNRRAEVLFSLRSEARA